MAYFASSCRHGILVHDEGDHVIGRSLQLYGEWAEEEIYLLSRIVRSGDTVIDIGANVGTHTTAFCRMVGPAGKVIAVDGQSAASSLLAMNIALNGLENASRIEGLVSDRSKIVFEQQSSTAKANIGAVSFENIERPVATQGADVLRPISMFSLDDLKVKKCRLIKIDIEGMELLAIKGAIDTLSSKRPFVYFEQTSNRDFAKIFDLLSQIGYKLYSHVANPFNCVNFKHSVQNIFGGTCEVNVLAVPDATAFEPPDHVELSALSSGEWVFPVGLVPGGWRLPEKAYAHLPPLLPRPGVMFPPEMLSVEHVGMQYANLHARFSALLNDRILAQKIMERQEDELKSLRRAGSGMARTA